MSAALDWAFEQEGLTMAEKFVLVALAYEAGSDKEVCVSQGDLVRMTGLNQRTVERALFKVESRGLRISRTPGGGNTYIFPLKTPGAKPGVKQPKTPGVRPGVSAQTPGAKPGVFHAIPATPPPQSKPPQEPSVTDALLTSQRHGVEDKGGPGGKGAGGLLPGFPVAERRAVAFRKPTLDEVRRYCEERNNHVDPEAWLDHYTSNGWRVGRNPMKDWRAAVRTWEKRDGRDEAGGEERPAAERAWLAKEAARIEREAEATRRSFLDDEVAVS